MYDYTSYDRALANVNTNDFCSGICPCFRLYQRITAPITRHEQSARARGGDNDDITIERITACCNLHDERLYLAPHKLRIYFVFAIFRLAKQFEPQYVLFFSQRFLISKKMML